ncbi:hypothetical protein MTR_7g010180 [Medicago truncatula]|uniref:Uncharacterized protein n=1 Tax=Medicago truncatula TaxID=3880 RepID=G7L0W2_MEDTR|nr:hypothetical protein MTR_7g010180 [Medicago truncatula]
MFIFFPWRINIYLSNNGIRAKGRHCCESFLDEREIRVAGRTKEVEDESSGMPWVSGRGLEENLNLNINI